MNSFKISVVSAEAEIFSGKATFVALPGEEGELGILPQHAPLLTRIRPGSVRIETLEGEPQFIFVAGGVLEVRPDEVIVLSDTAIRGKDLDEARANEARKLAQETIHNSTDSIEIAQAQAELAITVAQITALRQLREKRR